MDKRLQNILQLLQTEQAAVAALNGQVTVKRMEVQKKASAMHDLEKEVAAMESELYEARLLHNRLNEQFNSFLEMEAAERSRQHKLYHEITAAEAQIDLIEVERRENVDDFTTSLMQLSDLVYQDRREQLENVGEIR